MNKKTSFNLHCFYIRLLIGLLSIIFCTFSAPTLQSWAFCMTNPATLSTQHAFQQQLNPQLVAEIKALRIPGAVVFVDSRLSGPWTTTFGTSDLTTREAIKPEMHFRIGSITKTFVGTVILQLIDEGKLRLDDPLSKFQPEVPNGSNITIREVLNMTSGLFNYSEDGEFSRILNAELKGENPNRIWTPDELLSIAFKHAPYFAPGKGFHYSNTNFILLGLIIQQLTGYSPQHEIQQRIFKPLGMSHSLIPNPNSPAIPMPYSQGYTFQTPVQPGQTIDPTNATFINPSWAGTAGDAISTLGDLKIWIKALATGTLISPTLQKERLTFVPFGVTKPLTIKYGLAIFDDAGFIGHNGGLPGFQSFAVYNPTLQATVIVLTNLDLSANGSGTADTLAKIIILNLQKYSA
jgi:D-alanyl-D-alanine carboxypeptidase